MPPLETVRLESHTREKRAKPLKSPPLGKGREITLNSFLSWEKKDPQSLGLPKDECNFLAHFFCIRTLMVVSHYQSEFRFSTKGCVRYRGLAGVVSGAGGC